MPSNPQPPSIPFAPAPIPEAQAFRWGELLRPTQDALYELLVWLRAACDDSSRKDTQEHVSTSLLIHGARGTGKTTVFLSAAQALSNPDDFLKSEGSTDNAKQKNKELAEFLSKIKPQITWLEPLDLEPLPESANLLAAILVRVRAALDKTRKSTAGRKQGSWRGASLLEESAEDPWGKLDRLIRDASFMWEDIPNTTEARVRTEEQIKASEIFAHFQQSFIDAMDDVATTLALTHSSTVDDAKGILVLPIDNVDRSIGHLHNIVKLTRMVTSRRLWFIMAAGQEEFQLFMERSFQKELIVSGQAGLGPKGHDESMAIARRQAATTLRRALPPSYRIRIEPVNPVEAWEFTGNSNGGPRLHELLDKLLLPVSAARGHQLRAFAHLFDIGERLSSSVKEALPEEHQRHGATEAKDSSTTGAIHLTSAARMALTLPARTLRDLWHSARRESMRSQSEQLEKDEEPAESIVRIATEMLRNALDESELPAWASQQFHNRMLRRDVHGKMVLDLTGKPVRRARRTTLSDALEVSRGMFLEEKGKRASSGTGGNSSNSAVLISELHLRHIHDVILELVDLEDPRNRTHLPPSVAGWFMLLHDVLMLFDEPRVLNVDVTPYEISPELVVTLHELWVRNEQLQPLVKMDFLWSLPSWDMFLDFNIFTTQWKAFLPRMRKRLEGLEEDRYDGDTVALLFRLVLASWVDNIRSVASDQRGQWEPWQPEPTQGSVLTSAALERYEEQARAALGQLSQKCLNESKGYDRLRMARTWLEQLLPLLAQPEFAPSPELPSLLGHVSQRRVEEKAWKELVGHWKKHLPRLTRFRENLVRAVAMRSSSYEALRKASSMNPAGAEELVQAWLHKVTQAWFEVMDEPSARIAREEEVLQKMTPLELDAWSASREAARQDGPGAVHS
ncbi:hypothetical protein [Hyalangium gracile]|uniref:hypothetical protein n=1 Tax=Hyalangium gracile TaxID=394092 RepID=UPI001CCFC421|nr:hypothetical protein [Hyalangium gracile]